MVNSQSQSPQPLTAKNAIAPSSLVTENESNWAIADSTKLYNIKGWGEPYFKINAAGNVTVSPRGVGGYSVDLSELIESLSARQLNLPLLIRFPDILADRMARLQKCMDEAIARYGYLGSYQGVFPIKCNQNRHVIEAVIQHGKPYRFGLEAGSKPELAIALASLSTTEDCQLMCNGYKDREYIETALLATKLGQKPIIVIEQPQELDLVLKIAEELKIEPSCLVTICPPIKYSR